MPARRTMLRLALILALALAGSSCGIVEAGEEVRIRLTNASPHDFERVVVGFPDGRVEYGDLAAGQSSEYRSVPRAYGYAYVEAWVGDEKFVQQPIDYVGESLLEEGAYTYELTLPSLDDPLGLRTTLRRDGR